MHFSYMITTALITVGGIGTVLAQEQQPAPGGGFGGILPMMLVMFVIIYFMMIRPEQKKQKQRQELLKNLKKGDKVLTAGGIIGIVGNVKDNSVMVKVGENTVMEFTKSAVTSVITDEKTVEKEGKK